MITDPVSEISPTDRARALLKQIKSHQKAMKIIAEVLAILDEIDLRRDAAFVPAVKLGKAKVVYKVESTAALGECVAEYRPGSLSNPFRCPKALYEQIVGIFSRADKPLSLAEIVEQVEKKTGVKPGEHQYRVPIRLWMHVQPPMLARNRSLYEPMDAKVFTAKANSLWTDLKDCQKT